MNIYSMAIELTQSRIDINKASLEALQKTNAPQHHIKLIEKMIFHLEGQREVLKDLQRIYEPVTEAEQQIFTVPISLQ